MFLQTTYLRKRILWSLQWLGVWYARHQRTTLQTIFIRLCTFSRPYHHSLILNRSHQLDSKDDHDDPNQDHRLSYWVWIDISNYDQHFHRLVPCNCHLATFNKRQHEISWTWVPPFQRIVPWSNLRVVQWYSAIADYDSSFKRSVSIDRVWNQLWHETTLHYLR